MADRTPLTVITGPLGSGKTMLLRHIVATVPRRLAILMNEFGEIAIDSLTMPERRKALRYWGLALASHLQQRQVSQRMAAACQASLTRRGLHADIRLLDDDTAPQAGPRWLSLPKARTP